MVYDQSAGSAVYTQSDLFYISKYSTSREPGSTTHAAILFFDPAPYFEPHAKPYRTLCTPPTPNRKAPYESPSLTGLRTYGAGNRWECRSKQAIDLTRPPIPTSVPSFQILPTPCASKGKYQVQNRSGRIEKSNYQSILTTSGAFQPTFSSYHIARRGKPDSNISPPTPPAPTETVIKNHRRCSGMRRKISDPSTPSARTFISTSGNTNTPKLNTWTIDLGASSHYLPRKGAEIKVTVEAGLSFERRGVGLITC